MCPHLPVLAPIQRTVSTFRAPASSTIRSGFLGGGLALGAL